VLNLLLQRQKTTGARVYPQEEETERWTSC